MAQLHDIKIHYLISGKGPALVLLHGIGGRLQSFDYIVPELAKKNKVIRFDQRGFGKSDKPLDRPYDTGQWADDVAELLDILSIKKTAIGGHSLGGRVAAHFAAKYPDRTNALILMNTTVWGSNPSGAQQMLNVAARVREEGMKAAVATTPWIRSLNPKYKRLAETLSKRTLLNDPNAYALAAESVAADFSGKTDSSFVKTIQCPTLVIVGDGDSAPLEGAVNIRKEIQGAFLAVIPNCSHYSVYEKPHLLSEIVSDFLQSSKQK
ncbi:MAG: alpha/beta hydrolase [Thaumarchaeota archaeon]|nr:alpha/beta hydrolase [Nitrososphaerota archaeon]